MVTRSQSVQNFANKMSDLVNSKFLVAEKKISEVLVCISDSVLLFELFKHVSEGFDYATVKSVCFAHDGQGNGYFKLPKNEGDVLAFGLALLSEIDGGEIDILNLLDEYFCSPEGKQRSYSIFATQLLIPFQQIAIRLAKAIIESEDNGFIAKEEKVDIVDEKPDVVIKEEEKPKASPKNLNFGYVTALKNQVEQFANMLKKGREPYGELFFALEEMELYLDSKNLRGVTLAFTAIKYISQNVKKIDVDCDKIAQVIAETVV